MIEKVKIMRTTARETVFKILFSSQFNDDIKELKNSLYKIEKLNKNDTEYCDQILNTVASNREKLIEIIDERSKLFPQVRMFPADRSIILIALAENLCFIPDIPSAVSINEAANIASKYSSEKSASFISGILSEVIKEQNNV